MEKLLALGQILNTYLHSFIMEEAQPKDKKLKLDHSSEGVEESKKPRVESDEVRFQEHSCSGEELT